jgi:Zn-finger nucleic acid-binding protein
MLCPHCNATLLMTERQGVEIDYCPKCRGVWLDRGELEKLLDRSVERETRESPREPRERDMPRDAYRHDDDDDRHSDRYYGKRKKRESWFSEIFDWD